MPAALGNGPLFLCSKYTRGAHELYHLGSAQQNRREWKEQLQHLFFVQPCLVFEMAETTCMRCTLGPGLPDALPEVLGSSPALCVSLLNKSNCRSAGSTRSFTWCPPTFLKDSMIKKWDNHLSEKLSSCGCGLRFLWWKSLAWKQVSSKNSSTHSHHSANSPLHKLHIESTS